MKELSLFILIILLSGCTEYVEVERNITINHTVVVNNTIIKEVVKIKTITGPCNVTCPGCEYDNSREYILRLIKEAKQCEKQIHTNTTDLIEENFKLQKNLTIITEKYTECINDYCKHNLTELC